ncbi:uncharacterized protein LOC119363378 isoform X1 [Triticum dicoccoides]|uniref:uncharacterized protein LOC119363378 isoform X1 n=1 Tax=Triticum dicoccoides TaxID=85692 RepID=UPI00188EAF48|nr:uncharacterized protein LOC119363378 isoform X1 [Triticum dicoccoides]
MWPPPDAPSPASRRLPARSILVLAGSALPLGGHGRPHAFFPLPSSQPGATIREPAPLPTLRSAVRRAAAARIELLLPRRGAASWRAPFPATCLDDGARARPPPWYSSLSSQAAVPWRSPTALRQRSRLDGEGGGRCSAAQTPCGLQPGIPSMLLNFVFMQLGGKMLQCGSRDNDTIIVSVVDDTPTCGSLGVTAQFFALRVVFAVRQCIFSGYAV